MSEEIYHVITANRLDEGNVVYLDESDCWSDDFSKAMALSTEQQIEKKMAIAVVSVTRHTVLDPYPVEVEWTARDEFVPVRARERIRASGPSVTSEGVRHNCMKVISPASVPAYPPSGGGIDQSL